MKKILLGLLVAIIIIIGGFVIWGLTPQGPMPDVQPFLQSDEGITVSQDNWLTFMPEMDKVETGFIFYPGGHVNYRSYAPIAFQLAQKGLLVVIAPMPLSLAVLNPDAAGDIIAAYPQIKTWVIGGHSLGGAMAANYTYNHPGDVAGLVLWAAYPAKSNDLSSTQIPVLSIFGDKDGQAEKLREYTNLIPVSADIVEIKGGNHSQMGWYGDQSGDNPSTITRLDQQKQIIDATWNFILGLNH
jgi:pimeloyl-ACP methyl ester carboxylesterase